MGNNSRMLLLQENAAAVEGLNIAGEYDCKNNVNVKFCSMVTDSTTLNNFQDLLHAFLGNEDCFRRTSSLGYQAGSLKLFFAKMVQNMEIYIHLKNHYYSCTNVMHKQLVFRIVSLDFSFQILTQNILDFICFKFASSFNLESTKFLRFI